MKNMKKVLYVILFVSLFLPIKNVKADEIVNLPITITVNNTETTRFINYLNEQRVADGREPYVADSILMEIAKQRAADICVFFSHASTLGGGSGRVVNYIEQVLGREEDPNKNEFEGEDIAVGIGNAEGVYRVWRNSTTHAPVLIAKSYKYCGVAHAEYNHTGYWVLIATTFPLGSPASLTQGIQNWSTTVPTISYYFKPLGLAKNVYYKETKILDHFYINNRGDDTGVASGYEISNAPGLFTVRSNNPDLFTVSTDFKIHGLKVGNGSMSILLCGNEIGTVPVSVWPQTGQYENNGVIYKFNSTWGKDSFDWTGSQICPKPTSVTDWYGNRMVEGVDYTVSYSNNINPGYGTAEANIVGLGEYEGSVGIGSLRFSIIKKEVPVVTTPSTSSVSSSAPSQQTASQQPVVNTTPSAQTKQPTTSSSGEQAAKPYTPVTLSGNAPATKKLTSGTFIVTVSGSSQKYTGKEIKPTVYVKNGKTSISAGNYTVTYSNNVKPGTAKVTVKGRGDYVNWGGSTTFKIEKPVDEKTFKVELKKTSVNYNGKSQKPAIKSVKFKGKSVSKKFYSVSYKNNKNVGTATVIVTGKGHYKGYKGTATFKINPKLAKAKISKAKSTKAGELSIGWKKVSQADGYQVQICLSKNFKSGVKTVDIKGYSKISGTASNLKSKKTFYIRVRAKRTANGKTWYGAWSSVKEVKTK